MGPKIKKKIIVIISVTVSLACIFIAAFMFCDLDKDKLLGRADKNGNDSITFLNVGNADCILIKSGKHAALIDTGDIVDNGSKVVSELNKQSVSNIDYVFITHPHTDHIGGSAAIINNFKVNKFITPSVDEFTYSSSDALSIYDYILKKSKAEVIKAGNTYTVGVFKVEIIYYNTDFKDENDRSTVYKVSAYGKTMIAGGDAGLAVEDDMLMNNISVKANIFKMFHHGSNTAYDITFIKRVAPEYIVVSADTSFALNDNSDNIKLNLPNVKISRTDTNGNISYYFNKNGIKCVEEN